MKTNKEKRLESRMEAAHRDFVFGIADRNAGYISEKELDELHEKYQKAQDEYYSFKRG